METQAAGAVTQTSEPGLSGLSGLGEVFSNTYRAQRWGWGERKQAPPIILSQGSKVTDGNYTYRDEHFVRYIIAESQCCNLKLM